MIELALFLMLLTVLAAPRSVLAQVSVNPGALDQLQPAPPAPPVPQTAAKPAPKSAPHASRTHPLARHSATTTAKPQVEKTKPPATAPVPPAKPPAVAPAPPPTATLTPPVVAPVKPVIPAPPVPVTDGAAGEAIPIDGGFRITFGAGSSDLNPAMAGAVKTLADSVKADPNIDLNLYAYSTGPADDPSTPRRLSLSRALALRSLLIAAGLPSTRIYVRVMPPTPAENGATPDAPPDRVDVVRATGSPTKGATPSSTPPGPVH